MFAEHDSNDVYLLVFDLSNGLAKQLSFGLTGHHFEAIFHTSIRIFGKEYAYGQGIEEADSLAKYGKPIQEIHMGKHQLDQGTWNDYLEEMKSIWTKEKYHLIENNCNTFTDHVCKFLLGKGIPDHITGLPAKFLETDFGKMMMPMLEHMFTGNAGGDGRSLVAEGAIKESLSALQSNPHGEQLLSALNVNVVDDSKTKLNLKVIPTLFSSPPIKLTHSSDVSLIFKKMYELIKAGSVKVDLAPLENLESWMTNADFIHSTILPHDWHVVPFQLLKALDVSLLWPLLDILRLLSINAKIHSFLLQSEEITFLVKRVSSAECESDQNDQTKIMLLRLICNLSTSATLLEDTTAFLTDVLSSGSHPKIQHVSILAIFNYSIFMQNEQDMAEMLAAVALVLETPPEDDEILFRLLGAAALILHKGQSDVVELGRVVDMEKAVKDISENSIEDRIQDICSDILSILRSC